ncbi:MAG: peroxiredoxin [Alcaligenaceae bacterium]
MTDKKTADLSLDQLGKPAPAFIVQSTIGQITLAQCLGRAVVLYFYPKDSTPGCTTETENFRDLHSDFLRANCAIVGASRDSLKSHENFSNKLGLPFPLIADPDENLCALYQVMKLKNMYGKQVRGIERSTFLIDTKGNLARVWRGVKVPGHAQEVLEAARALA